MPNTYFFAARPETLASIIYTGKLPDVLPNYITERHIKLYASHQEALENNSAISTRQMYLIAMEIPENASTVTTIREGQKEYKQATQLELNWLSKIYVSSLAGEKTINILCGTWCKNNQHQNNGNHCRLPVEIDAEYFESKVVSTKATAKEPSVATLSKLPAFFAGSSSSMAVVRYLKNGNVLKSKMQVLVNTVNCVGAMGKGIALAFKKEYPAMFKDYQERCARREVKLGEPYLYKVNDEKWILNFPTKYHWANDSQLSWIENGLKYLVTHAAEWGIQSMAFPPLGCGNGNLKWNDVYPEMRKYLDKLSIPIEIHAEWDEPKQIVQTASVKKRKLNSEISANDNSTNSNNDSSNASMTMGKK